MAWYQYFTIDIPISIKIFYNIKSMKFHFLNYILSKSIPGLVSFVVIIYFTRKLSVADYGYYSTMLTISSLFSIICYQWIKSSIVRFRNIVELGEYQNTIKVTFYLSTVALFVTSFIFGVLNDYDIYDVLLILMMSMLLGRYDILLEYQRSNFESKVYSKITVIKSVLFICIGIVLLRMFEYTDDLQKFTLPFALICSLFFVTLFFKCGENEKLESKLYKNSITVFFRYGAPLTLAFALSYIVSASDRLFIKYYMDYSMVGMYSASYDMPNLIIGTIFTVINLTIQPYIIKCFDLYKNRFKACYKFNISILIWVCFPVVLVFVLYNNMLSDVLFDGSYSMAAKELFPLISVASFLCYIKASHFDIIFQIEKKTKYQIYINLVAAFSNIVFNFLFIPKHGVIGAAYATLLSYLLGLLCSAVLGGALFKHKIVSMLLLKVLLINLLCVFMFYGLKYIDISDWLSLLTNIILYLLLTYFLDIYSDFRNELINISLKG